MLNILHSSITKRTQMGIQQNTSTAKIDSSRGNQPNEFTNGDFNEFKKETRNILNHVETFATFDSLDNVLSGYGPGCNVPSVGTPLASCSSRITGLYLDVFQKCSEFCGVKSLCLLVCFSVINRTEDAQLYLDVYRKYSRVSGKVPCSSTFVGGVGDGLDKRKLQQSGRYDVFEAYLALCSSGAGSRHSRSLSHIPTIFNSNLVHTDFNSLCGPSASLPGRSFHANRNAVTITDDSQNSYPVSRDGGNTRENCQLRSTIGTSYTYSDFGDCDRRCRYCGASFWYVERLKGHSHNQTPEYHLCCGGGRIQMQPTREPPEYIKSLFENKHFMENIHAYNQMFAITSFGAKIDESINAGRGSMHHFGGIDNSQLEPGIVEARDKFRELDIPEFKIRLYNAQGARGYELPTSNTLGAMVFESGYHTKLILKSANGVGRGKRVTMLAYYIYQLHFRLQQYDLLFREGLYDAISQGERDGYEVGGRIILPMSFTGGPQYMYAHFRCSCYLSKVRKSTVFITFTCNVNWPEIKRSMSEYPHLTASDRADVVCRVFEQKIQALIAFLKE
ncbi:DNA helicase [Tanacetum coccineum]